MRLAFTSGTPAARQQTSPAALEVPMTEGRSDWRLRARPWLCGFCQLNLHPFCVGRAGGCPCDHLSPSDTHVNPAHSGSYEHEVTP